MGLKEVLFNLFTRLLGNGQIAGLTERLKACENQQTLILMSVNNTNDRIDNLNEVIVEKFENIYKLIIELNRRSDEQDFKYGRADIG